MTHSVDELVFIEVTITIHSDLADALGNYISENFSKGFQQLETANKNVESIRFYVPESLTEFRGQLNEYLSQIASINKIDKPLLSERRIVSRDWEESYRRSIEPVYIDDSIVVRPPWAELNKQVEYDIIIEPKMAFGTGHHETTRTCLKLIHKYFKKGRRMLDFGCGSGVLAILAGKIGASYIKAVDYDEISIENTEDNFGINNIKSDFEIVLGSFEKTAGDEPYDMVCANLRKDDLVENFQMLIDLTADNGYLMISGLLEEDKEEIENYIKRSNQVTIEFIHDGEWLTYLVQGQ